MLEQISMFFDDAFQISHVRRLRQASKSKLYSEDKSFLDALDCPYRTREQYESLYKEALEGQRARIIVLCMDAGISVVAGLMLFAR